jgi:hypothetical protein
MLIKRVYEIDPLSCPKCGGRLKVIAFIEPPQAEVIEKILRHCGLWNPPPARPPPAGDASLHDPDEPRELTYVDSDTLCGRPHKVSYVAQPVMWRSSFLPRYFGRFAAFLRHIIPAVR